MSAVQRTCSKDYPVPNSNFTVPKGLMVNFPPGENCFKNQGLQIVSKQIIFYLKNIPDKFDPENFNPENNPNKFGFTGFGQGPRNCIGECLLSSLPL